MFQAHVAGFLHEDCGIIRRGENLLDRNLMRDCALRESKPIAARLQYPKLQQRADPPQGARRITIAQCGRARR